MSDIIPPDDYIYKYFQMLAHRVNNCVRKIKSYGFEVKVENYHFILTKKVKPKPAYMQKIIPIGSIEEFEAFVYGVEVATKSSVQTLHGVEVSTNLTLQDIVKDYDITAPRKDDE